VSVLLLIAAFIAGFFLFLYVGLLLYKRRLKSSTKIETSNGISSLEEIRLGNLNQWIFIRGANRNNPVLLFLHGGPGAPLFGISSSRKYDAELIKHFTVVHWDQRGAGKSFNNDIPVESMTLNRLVEDCNELIDHLRGRFHTQKIFVVAHSGGTVIGIKVAHKYPDKIHAYVGVAQVINEHEQQKVSYDFLLNQAAKSGSAAKQKSVEAIGPPPYDSPDEFLKMAGHITKYGGFMHSKSMKDLIVLALNFLTSPEYSLSEGIRTFRNKGFDFTINAMWEELKKINLTEKIRSVEVPVYFFEGRYDMTTPTVIVENFYDNLNAEKGKKLFVFEHSGHMPMMEEKERYEELLINVVLRESLDSTPGLQES